jgi:hypothetical protein
VESTRLDRVGGFAQQQQAVSRGQPLSEASLDREPGGRDVPHDRPLCVDLGARGEFRRAGVIAADGV